MWFTTNNCELMQEALVYFERVKADQESIEHIVHDKQSRSLDLRLTASKFPIICQVIDMCVNFRTMK